MVLTLLRHAAPLAEYHGCYNGHTDIPIDPTLFDHSKVAPLMDQTFDRIYTSDLIRCGATLKQMQIHDYLIDPRLREVRFKSAIEGKRFSDIEQLEGYSPKMLDSPSDWHAFICDEPLQLFQERIQSFLNDLPNEDTILLCTHGGVIAMILSLLVPDRTTVPLAYLDHVVIPRSLR